MPASLKASSGSVQEAPIPSRRASVGAGDLAAVLAIVMLPLLGALLAGRDWHAFFVFPPPLRIPSEYVHFSWTAVVAAAGSVALFALSWTLGPARSNTEPQPRLDRADARRSFPWWGWSALAWTCAWWVLAWTRWPWFEPFQRYTFFPLWLGLIVTVNALTQRRAGSCLMLRAPGQWLGLFATSALFWWVFEWLNRFVRNWHYLIGEDVGAGTYAVHATLCFSTVLPAVAAVAEWLSTHPGWRTRMAAGPAWPWLENRRVAGGLLLLSAGALLLTGAYPGLVYAALWLAPLGLALSGSVLLRRQSVAGEMAHGNWTRAGTWMLAALICGVFWEMWNAHSLAKWIYTVPGVERWHVFEMPLLGYAGYLPFGLECLIVAERLTNRSDRRAPGT